MKKTVSLSVGRGEKLPVSKGAGLTEKGREKYNRETGSNLKAPAPNPKTEADKFYGFAATEFAEYADSETLLEKVSSWVGSRLRFSGEASAEAGSEAALSNLLNIIGRRQGERSLLSLG